MTKIFKYALKIDDEQTIRVPAPIKVLSAQIQNDELCLWVLLLEKAPKENLPIKIVGTGHEFDDWNEWEYLTTVQDGPMVWHVWYQDPNGVYAQRKVKRTLV